MRLRRISHCSVPGHGTDCEVAHERVDRYPRSTEERVARDFEEAAEREEVAVVGGD